MILSALVRYYQRLLERKAEGIAPYGYSPEKISYEIVLAPDGRVMQVNNIRDTSGKKPMPRMLEVPQPEKRTVGIKPNFLWDKTSYVLGVSTASKRAGQEHEAFKALHEQVLAETEDEGLKAFLRFLKDWTPDKMTAPAFPEDMLDTNVVFRLDGEHRYIHERDAARTIRARLLGTDTAASGTCLALGEYLPIARLHPPIKGVNGAQTSGASIVSFNQEAFTSYGKTQGDNAPISESAAFAYTSVLNYLLRRSTHNRQRLQIGDASIVFWAEAENDRQAEAAELLLADLLDPPPDDSSEAEKVRRVLDGIAKGRPPAEIDPGLDSRTRMYVLGLAPNASRLSIRFWLVDSLDALAGRLSEHERDMRIEPRRWKTEPAARRLVLATVPNREGSMPKADDAINNLVGEMMRAILSGGLYPRSLLANTIMRMRADGNLSDLRVAICKGVLAREWRKGIRTSNEEIPVSLDKQSTEPSYLLGRLFAVLERIQRSALGQQINATIRDRYYGAASATPASIFPVLLRNTQNHIGKVRKESPGLATAMEKDIREIIGGLPVQFPRSLRIEDQGRFAIGYYHQAQSQYTQRGSNNAADNNESETGGAQQ